MSVVALYTVGNSDLLLDGKPLNNPRQQGQELLNAFKQSNFEQYASPLTFPLLEPCLNYILARHACLNRLVLFGTNRRTWGAAATVIPFSWQSC